MVKEAAVLAAWSSASTPGPPTATRPTPSPPPPPPGPPARFAEAYRRLLDPTAEPAVQVLALGRARDALCALADREAIPYQAAGLDGFL